PLYLLELPDLSVADAVFESFSGLTTTGATVITGLDTLPRALLFYRQQLQWFGGMGIIVLAVAILPLLGVGGMQLYRAGLPCALASWAAGRRLFAAIGHSSSGAAIGGFSSRDTSIGYCSSPIIELICVCFRVLSGINCALHFAAWRFRWMRRYCRDPECRAYV